MITSSPLDGYRDQIEAALARGQSYRQIVRWLEDTFNLETSERSLRRAVRRWGIAGNRKQHAPQFDRPGVHVHGDEADVTSDPRTWKGYLNNTDDLLIERGLDPEDWQIQSLVVNEWDSPTGETLKQLKVHLKRMKKLEMIFPVHVSLGRVFRKMTPVISDTEPELVVLVGDQHAPYHDPELHKRFCAFLHDQAPERGVLMGDGVDLPTISRHPQDPDWAPKTQECLNSFGQVILDYREASEDTSWVKLPGNHLERLRRVVIDRLAEWYGLTPAQIEGLPDLPPFHDPAYLLRLDELGVEYLRPRGKYDQAKYMVSRHLGATHGSSTRKGSGASALGALEKLDHSIVIGHTHRQSLVQRTVQQIDGTGRLLQAGETGCMCRIEGGLGYAPGPDWSNGYITASVWPGGTFKLDLATYVDKALYWRSERY